MQDSDGKSGVLEFKRLELGPYATNAYILVCAATRDSILIDAPDDAEAISSALAGTNLKRILITHGHFDHTGAMAEVRARFRAPVSAHESDAESLPVKPDSLLGDDDILGFGRLKLTVLHTPGHTPGSVCLLCGNDLFCGDTMFPGGPGHTDSPTRLRTALESIKNKILVLPDETRLYPGHGADTTLGAERPQIAAFLARRHAGGLCGDVTWQST